MKLGVRWILGYHTTPNDRSVLTYSRDVQSAPLEEVAALKEAIAIGAFLPDAIRTKRKAQRQDHVLERRAREEERMEAEARRSKAGREEEGG